MIRLHYANRLEGLVPPLAAAIAARQRIRPLERVTIVVPSRVLEHYLKHRLSEAIGIAANLDFPFLRRFLAQAVEKAEPTIRILDVEELELVLFGKLRALIRSGTSGFEAVRNYIEVEQSTEAEREVRAFRLAARLARLFREYSISRQSMLQKWKQGSGIDPQSETEPWQKLLWTFTFDPQGRLRDKSGIQSESDWMLLPDAFETVSHQRLKAAFPEVVHLFGLAYAGHAYVRMMSLIGQLAELTIYALNPCYEFWEDVRDPSPRERSFLVRQHSKLESGIDASLDPFDVEETTETPALRLWARPGREYLRMLNELTDCDFESHFSNCHDSDRPTLLASVQQDTLTRAPARTSHVVHWENDSSIRFLACPGIVREAEIIASKIWEMLEDDEPRGLRFHEIGVLIPDVSYQQYLPHLENAFLRLHQLPMNTVSRSSTIESPVREAVALLLRLPLGRLSRDEILHVLNHPVIRGEGAEFEPEQVSRWCEKLGIFFGADAEDLAHTYIPSDSYHWDQGLRRLALGVFMNCEDDEAKFFSPPDSIEYLPCAIVQDESAAAASFISRARLLLCDVVEIRSLRESPVEWSRILGELLLKQVHVTEPADERALRRCIEAIESIAGPGLKAESMGYPAVHDLVSNRIAELESQLTQFTEHGIVVGPLSALRAIPFRVVFLAGLNEGEFPARDSCDPIDLKTLSRRAGDVSPTERDRYLFLETILATRERISLSYQARDSNTGHQLEPSSVVRELQFILRGYIAESKVADLTIKHPLSRYDNRYFRDIGPTVSAGTTFRSYDSEAKRGAIAASLREDLGRTSGDLPLPDREEPVFQQLSKDTQHVLTPVLAMTTLPPSSSESSGISQVSLPVSALRTFLECPLQAAARYALGMFEDEENPEHRDDEPLAQSILNRTNLLREVFWKVRGNANLITTAYDQTMRLSRLRGQAPSGVFGEASKKIDLKSLAEWTWQAREAGCVNLDRWQKVRIGRGQEFADADRILPELTIQVRNPADPGALTLVRIYGNLGFLSPSGKSSLALFARDKPRAKDFVGLFAAAMVLAASGEASGLRFNAIAIGAGKNRPWHESRTLECPDGNRAREYLSNLLGDLLFARNHYFLPIEAIEKVIKNVERARDDEVVDSINELRENDFSRCSSDYGPVRNARRFDPPDIEQLKDIIHRRFTLVRPIFMGKED